MNPKIIRAALRNYHPLKARAEQTGEYEISSGEESISLLDLEVAVRGSILSPRRKQAIFYALVEDMHPSDVAKIMGISEGSVNQHVDQACKELARLWQ